MAPIKIPVVNLGTLVKAADLAPVVAALQRQVTEDFAPVWGMDADLRVVRSFEDVTDTDWPLVLFDDFDTLLGAGHPLNVTYAKDNGFHDAISQGRPFARVFVRRAIAHATPWSLTASHELLEMLANPWLNAGVRFGDYGTADGRFMIWREVCDPCGAFGYLHDGNMVADFVHPTWFQSQWRWRERQFDQMKKMERPLQLLQGGDCWVDYLMNGWSKVTTDAEFADARARAHAGPVASASAPMAASSGPRAEQREYEYAYRYKRKYKKK